MSRGEELRRKQVAQMLAAMPDYVARLAWPRAQIELHRRRSLRLLLRVAMEYSPWYRERLRGIDPATATEADLASVEPTTRDDLMDNWDDIVIYPSLNLEMVEAHLRGLREEPLLFDSFHAVMSSGGGGRRGVFLYDWDGWIASFAGCARWRLRNRGRALEGVRPVVASVSDGDIGNIHVAINHTFALSGFHRVPANLPLSEIVRRLEQIRPDVLIGCPSLLYDLALEARKGALRIRPRYVSCSGENLLPQVRDELEEVWDARVNDGWGACEALPLGQSCSSGAGLHLSDDLLIVEPVDVAGNAVEPGCRSSAVLVTNLFNLALPLIRCELSDRVNVAPEPCPCGSAYTLVDEVQGHAEQRFFYEGGISVDPAELGNVLARERGLLAYQVRQTESGAEVRIRSRRPLHLRAVGHRVASALGKEGVDSPSVSVQRVDSIEREPNGKLRRYVPRPGSAPPSLPTTPRWGPYPSSPSASQGGDS